MEKLHEYHKLSNMIKQPEEENLLNRYQFKCIESFSVMRINIFKSVSNRYGYLN